MSRTSYALVSILVICLGLFGYITYFSPVESKLPTLKDDIKEDETYAEGSLSLSPATQTVTAGQTTTIDVFLETQNVTPTVLQFEVSYNPLLATPTTIQPKGYFKEPIILINTINPRNGRISFALKCSADYINDANAQCIGNSNEAVAQILFTVNPQAISQEFSFNIMPKTLLETKEASEVILKTTNAKVVIQGTVVPQASPSAAFIL